MLHCIRLSEKSELHSRIKEIYEASFPRDERRDYEDILRLLSSDGDFMVEAICDDNVVVGMLSSWNLGNWRYIEHFAVDAARRGCGIGRRVLQQYIDKSVEPVVLEVEPPIDEPSLRRVAFYNSMGFFLHNDYKYIQPSYGAGKSEIELKLMTCRAPQNLNMDEVVSLLYGRVYGLLLNEQ